VDQVAIGTLYKEMKLKPTVLKEYTENQTMAAQLAAETFTEADDSLILEDESARIKLTGNLDVSALVTGLVLAVRGFYDAKLGSLDVAEHTYAGGDTAQLGLT
jgi:DNA polymerase delta subunit 2